MNAAGVGLLGVLSLLTSGLFLTGEKTWHDERGRIHVIPAAVDPEINNAWPREWEEGWATRVDHALRYWAGQKLSFNSWGENEKWGYPQMMWAFLLGDKQRAVQAFEALDVQEADHRHTLGIDFYWCFTLKGQMRKYFYFGDALSQDYRLRFVQAARLWTEQDPYRRPHPVYGAGGKKDGWGPDAKGSWVDIRRTDNLRAMCDTSVYLMAELAGNESVRQIYKDRLLSYVRMLYHVGMMEWDSENYHGHTLAAYHNLYDFAKDREVKRLAKAALDWLYAAAALKYWRGGFGGPNNRDYGAGNVVFGAAVVHPLWLYFGDTVSDDPRGHYDDVHHVTSAYRPPPAVVELARKHFSKGVELHATKPYYRLWEPGMPVVPQYWETLYLGQTFQLGTCRSAEPVQEWNPSVFKMMTWNSSRGVDFVVINTSPLAQHSCKNPGDQIAHYRNLVIWLRPANNDVSAFYFQVPKTARCKFDGQRWFVELEQTYLAFWPIGISSPRDWGPEADGEGSAAVSRSTQNLLAELYKDERFFKAEVTGQTYAGFALEVGEQPDYANLADFERAVRTSSQLDTKALVEGEVSLTGADGHKLTIRHNPRNDLPEVYRDGQLWDYKTRLDVYQSEEQTAPIQQKWQSGTLTVEAGGTRFTCTVTVNGEVSWRNE